MPSRLICLALPMALIVGCSKTESTPPSDGDPQAASPQKSDSPESTPPSPAETVKERVSSAIAMLEAKQYKEFLESFLVPEELKERKDSGQLEGLLEQFPNSHAPELLEALRSARQSEPTMGEDQKTAWFALEKEIAGQNELVFVRVDGSWFIPNRPPKKQWN